MGVKLDSETPASVEVKPVAIPSVAVIVPAQTRRQRL